MKKILLFLSAIPLLAFAGTAQGYVVHKGDTVNKIAAFFHVSLQTIIADNNIKNVRALRVGQNLSISGSAPKQGMIGAAATARPTNFQTNLATQLTAGQTGTTLPVTSIQTRDGNTLSPTVLGNIIVLTINPNGSNAENVLCTSLTTSTKTFTGCGFGYRFDNPLATSTANILSHSPGEPVIISDTDTYNALKFVSVDGDTTITASDTVSGQWTFSTLPYGVTTTPTDQRSFVTLYQFQQATSTGGINGSETVKGVWQGATQAQMASSTNVGSTGANLVLQSQYASSTGGVTTVIPVTNSSGKLSSGFGGVTSSLATLNASTLVVQNPASATTTATANSIPLSSASGTISRVWVPYGFGGTGADGALLTVNGATTTINAASATTTIMNYTSINIVAGSTTTISNPGPNGTILILKSQGNCIIAGAIQLKGMGASVGKEPYNVLDDTTTHSGGSASGGTAGTSGAIFSNLFLYLTPDSGRINRRFVSVSTGASGGNGAVGLGGAPAAGVGGVGGGALEIECGGTLTFTGNIILDGTSGTGTDNSGNQYGSGGGGGGGAGQGVIIANAIGTNTGTFSARGGSGGTASANAGGGAGGTGGGGGGGGGCYDAAGPAGATGISGNGTAGTGSGTCAGASGASGNANGLTGAHAGGTNNGVNSTNSFNVILNTVF